MTHRSEKMTSGSQDESRETCQCPISELKLKQRVAQGFAGERPDAPRKAFQHQKLPVRVSGLQMNQRQMRSGGIEYVVRLFLQRPPKCTQLMRTCRIKRASRRMADVDDSFIGMYGYTTVWSERQEISRGSHATEKYNASKDQISIPMPAHHVIYKWRDGVRKTALTHLEYC